MKSVLVILAVLVAIHTAGSIVEVIRPVIERSTVPGVPDRVKYVRHIQYGRVGELEASPWYRAQRMKRQDNNPDLETGTKKDVTNLDSARNVEAVEPRAITVDIWADFQ